MDEMAEDEGRRTQEEGRVEVEGDRLSLGCEIGGCLHWLLPKSPSALSLFKASRYHSGAAEAIVG